MGQLLPSSSLAVKGNASKPGELGARLCQGNSMVLDTSSNAALILGPPHNGCIGGRASTQDSSFQARFPSVAPSAPPNLIIQWQTSQRHVGGSCSPAHQSPVPPAPGEEGRPSARIGCTLFSFHRSPVLLARSAWSRPTPLFQQSCGVPHFQESLPSPGQRASSLIYPRTGAKMWNHTTGKNC